MQAEREKARRILVSPGSVHICEEDGYGHGTGGPMGGTARRAREKERAATSARRKGSFEEERRRIVDDMPSRVVRPPPPWRRDGRKSYSCRGEGYLRLLVWSLFLATVVLAEQRVKTKS